MSVLGRESRIELIEEKKEGLNKKPHVFPLRPQFTLSYVEGGPCGSITHCSSESSVANNPFCLWPSASY